MYNIEKARFIYVYIKKTNYQHGKRIVPIHLTGFGHVRCYVWGGVSWVWVGLRAELSVAWALNSQGEREQFKGYPLKNGGRAHERLLKGSGA
jgi:hypothetical protein